MSRGVCTSRHVIFSFVYHAFSLFSYFSSPGLPSAAGQITWFRPNYGCARSLTDGRLHYNMLYNNISTRVHACYTFMQCIMCTAVIYPSTVCFISQAKRTCAEWSEEANQTPRVNRRTIARHELSARACVYIGRDVILLI